MLRGRQPPRTPTHPGRRRPQDGTVNFALTMRRAEYFIPAGILLKCFLEVSFFGGRAPLLGLGWFYV